MANKRSNTKITNRFEPTYNFDVQEKVIYLGKLYEEYHNKECIIISRSKSKGKVYYIVEFNDGIKKTMEQKILKAKHQQITIDDINNEVK